MAHKKRASTKRLSSQERMKKAEEWVNAFQPSGKSFNTGNFQKNLENGLALAYVALGIDEGIAHKHFKQKDLTKPKIGPFPNKIRVTAFVNFCKAYGCDERDLFRTVYLTEPKDQKDLDAVVRTLENLSSLIDSKGGNQPSLIGIKGRKKLAPSKNQGNTGDYDTYGIVKHANVARTNWTAKQYDALHKGKKPDNVVPQLNSGSKHVDTSSEYDSRGIVTHPNVANSNWNKDKFEANNNWKKKSPPSSAAPPLSSSSSSSSSSGPSWKKPATSSSTKGATWQKPGGVSVKSTASALWGNDSGNNGNTVSSASSVSTSSSGSGGKKKTTSTASALWGNNGNDSSSNNSGLPKLVPPPPPPDAVPHSEDAEDQKQAAPAAPAPAPPSKFKAKPPSGGGHRKKQSNNYGMDHSNDKASFGFSAEQAAKQASKYNDRMEKSVVSWINKVVGSGAQGGGPLTLQSSLKNGVVLCKLINCIKPNSIKSKILTTAVGKTGAMASFADKQRINEYSRVAKSLGLPSASMFEAEDLWEGKNMTAVLNGLYGFGVLCHQKNIPGSKGGIVGTGAKDNRSGGLY